MYYLQHFDRSIVRTWARDRDAEFETFDSALDALERCDEIRDGFANDGMRRRCRVVDDDANVIEYGSKTAEKKLARGYTMGSGVQNV